MKTQWPWWQKEAILLIVGLSSAITGAYGPMLSPGFVQIADELHISVTALAQATAWMILACGLALFVLNALAKVYGKRPMYLFAITLLFISAIIGGSATNDQMFLTSRVLGGIGGGPFEILIQCTIGDLYFVHERATRIAFWNLCLFVGISLGSIISGYVISNIGWNWCFWISAVFYGISGLLIFFCVPETSYERKDNLVLKATVEETFDDEKGVLRSTVAMHVEHDDQRGEPLSRAATVPEKMSYWRSLRLFTGRHSKASIFTVFSRPFVLFMYPAIGLTFLTYGVMITWYVAFSVVVGIIFVAPPYNFTVSQVGLINLSPLIFSIVGEVISGPLNDALCLHLTKKNKGIYEPEFRLVMMTVVALTGAVGFYGFGLTVHYQTHWTGPVLTYGICSLSLAFVSTCMFGYVLDSHPNLNEEAFVVINARAVLGFGLFYVLAPWLMTSGILNVFVVFGSITLFTCALVIPLWIFGKRWRSWIARNELLQRLTSDA